MRWPEMQAAYFLLVNYSIKMSRKIAKFCSSMIGVKGLGYESCLGLHDLMTLCQAQEGNNS